MSHAVSIALAAALATACYGLRVAALGQRVSPDGHLYAGTPPRPIPLHFRWSVPSLCRGHVTRWKVVTGGSLILSAALVALILGQAGLEPVRCLFGAALFCGLGGMFHVNATLPVLVDAPAFLAMLGAVSLEMAGFVWPAVAVVLIGATIKETVPVFAAAATLNPLFLIGLVAVALRLLVRAKGRAPGGWERQRHKIMNPRMTLLPWGACLVALWAPTWPMAISMALAYGVLLWATDTTRVCQWACLPLILATATIVPATWLLPVAVAHLASPYVGDIQ